MQDTFVFLIGICESKQMTLCTDIMNKNKEDIGHLDSWAIPKLHCVCFLKASVLFWAGSFKCNFRVVFQSVYTVILGQCLIQSESRTSAVEGSQA